MKLFQKFVWLPVAVLAVSSVSAAAQDRPTQTPATTVTVQSACEIPTKGLEKGAKKLIELKCELEQAQLRRDIRDAGKPKMDASPSKIGVASDNRAVTTVTYRNSDGTALEGSKDWAKHEENMAKIAHSSGCGFLGFGCPALGAVGYYTTGGYYGNYGPARVNGYGGGYRSSAHVNGYGGNQVYQAPPPQQPSVARVCGYSGC